MKKSGLGPALGQGTELGMTMGLTSAGCVVLGLFAGRWIDAKLGTSPVATVLLLISGAVAGQLALYRLATRTTRQLSDDPEARMSRRDGLKAIGVALGGLALVTVPAVMAILLGLWLDNLAGTSALITIVLVVGSLIGGIYGMLKLFRTLDSASNEGDASCSSEGK